MKTHIFTSDQVGNAADLLKRGEVVAFPTETVYGLGSPVFSEESIRKIFLIKGRPADNPIIVHVASLEQVEKLATNLPDSFHLLVSHFWPGPLTLIVQKSPLVPDVVSGGRQTIAIRMPIHPIARRLILELGEPIVAPSANLSGRPSPTTALDVLEDLEGKIPAILDGGRSAIGIESTVLSLVGAPTLLRPGIIGKEMLERVLKCPIALPSQETLVQSPGMRYRHYAPKAPIRLVFEQSELKGTGYVIDSPTARSLFAELRKADRLGAQEIEIFCDATTQSNTALMDRLLRASGQMVYTSCNDGRN